LLQAVMLEHIGPPPPPPPPMLQHTCGAVHIAPAHVTVPVPAVAPAGMMLAPPPPLLLPLLPLPLLLPPLLLPPPLLPLLPPLLLLDPPPVAPLSGVAVVPPPHAARRPKPNGTKIRARFNFMTFSPAGWSSSTRRGRARYRRSRPLHVTIPTLNLFFFIH
jgi:hypothetical protein